MRSLALLVCIAASATAFADAAVDKIAFTKHLRDGRRHSARHEWAPAVKDLEEAHKLAPRDESVSLELGWVAFRAGDHARARAVDAELLAATQDKELRAKVLYNEGRIDESEGDKSKAADHYKQSLALRDNQVVKARLDGLARAGASASEDHIAPRTFATLAELCRSLIADMEKDDDATDATCDVFEKIAGPPAAAVLSVDAGGCYSGTYGLHLAVRLGGRWSDVDAFDGPSCEKGGEAGLGLTKLRLVTVGRAKVLWVGLQESSSGHEHTEHFYGEETDSVVLCPVAGVAGAPTCTERLPVKHSWTDEVDPDYDDSPVEEGDPPKPDTSVTRSGRSRYRLDLSPDGTATLVQTDNRNDGDFDAPTGPHKLW